MTATVLVFTDWIDAGIFTLAVLSIPFIAYCVKQHERSLAREIVPEREWPIATTWLDGDAPTWEWPR